MCFSFLFCYCLFLPGISQAVGGGSADHLVIFKAVSGNNCGANDSLRLEYKNTGTKDICVRVCLQKISGKYECGMNGSFSPGDTSSFYTCHSTGKYKTLATFTSEGYDSCRFNPNK